MKMLKNLNKKFKIRLAIGFFFLIAIDLGLYIVFERDTPSYVKVIGSMLSSGFIVLGLAFFFNKYKKIE
ncbi:hypothetical protein GCM10027454_34960 [Algoriphagus aestuariicola]